MADWEEFGDSSEGEGADGRKLTILTRELRYAIFSARPTRERELLSRKPNVGRYLATGWIGLLVVAALVPAEGVGQAGERAGSLHGPTQNELRIARFQKGVVERPPLQGASGGAVSGGATPEAVPLGREAAVPLGREAKGESWTLSDLQSIALANHPGLAREAARVDAARGAWVQQGLYPNPTFGYAASEVGNDGKGGQQGMYFGQEIVRGGKLSLDRAVAAQRVREAQQHYWAERRRVENDVRIGFFDALVAQRAVELTAELVGIGERGLQAADALLKAQEVSRVDLLQARVELNNARIAAANAQNRLAAAWRRLTAVAGAPELAPAPLVGNLMVDQERLEWETSLARVLGQSPELGAARAALDRAGWSVRRAQAEPIPNVDFQSMFQHDNATTSDIVGVQITVPVPVVNKNQGGIRQAQADLRAARADVARLQLDLQQRLASAFERYANARQQAERYEREILPDARASLDLVTSGYRQGEFNYVTLLTAQRTFSQTNLAYLSSLDELWQSSILIDGLLLSGSLGGAER